MILISDVDMMTCPHIVTDSDGEVTDNATAATNETTIAN
jgi:hypothetical protein